MCSSTHVYWLLNITSISERHIIHISSIYTLAIHTNHYFTLLDYQYKNIKKMLWQQTWILFNGEHKFMKTSALQSGRASYVTGIILHFDRTLQGFIRSITKWYGTGLTILTSHIEHLESSYDLEDQTANLTHLCVLAQRTTFTQSVNDKTIYWPQWTGMTYTGTQALTKSLNPS